jgi:hypothetical protein
MTLVVALLTELPALLSAETVPLATVDSRTAPTAADARSLIFSLESTSWTCRAARTRVKAAGGRGWARRVVPAG